MALLPPPSPSSRPRSSSDSPEFEFNPSFPSSTSLHSADQLFFRGLLLPLHLLHLPNSDSPETNPVSEIEPADPPASPTDTSPSILSAGIASSKRWRHVFNKTDKKKPPDQQQEQDKSKTKDTHKHRDNKDKKNRDTRKAAASPAELNINLWPFSRSRSAGNNTGGRTRSASAAARKVSSAPCSRSNSAGESKSRRNWPTSPARAPAGVHLGRTSPVWQLPRTSSGKASTEVTRRSKPVKAAGVNSGGKARVLSLSVPMCIGYRHHLSCRSDEASAVGGGIEGGTTASEEDGAGGASRIVGSSSSGNLFNLRSLFSKKVY